MSASSPRTVIIGGGVVGLSIAWELVVRGYEVTVVDKHRCGRKASWAGAGILVPTSMVSANPLDRLMAWGSQLHAQWHKRLLVDTGIDNGYRECGGLYVARTNGEKAALVGQKLFWSEHEIAFEQLSDGSGIEDINRLFGTQLPMDALVMRVPGESQIRNPDHLRALKLTCEQQGVEFLENVNDLQVDAVKELSVRLRIAGDSLEFDRCVFCAGAWSQQLLAEIDVHLPLIPVRGQMLMFKLERHSFGEIINEGSRYIVPREDGHVLVGSTTEEVGFDESTTAEKLAELMEFANGLVPMLNKDCLVDSWAGLRPAAHDGFPFIGRVARWNHVFVATGHFKAGLQMSPSTATMVCDLIEGKESAMSAAPFDPSRLESSREFVATERSFDDN